MIKKQVRKDSADTVYDDARTILFEIRASSLFRRMTVES